MIDGNVGRQSIVRTNPPDLSHVMALVQQGAVGNIINDSGLSDHFNLTKISFQTGNVPAISPEINLGDKKSPTQQILDLGKKYNIPYKGENINTYQSRVLKSVIMHKAMEHGIPMNVALGIAGNESGWKMWSDPNKGKLVEGKNIRNGSVSSTDWGAMQINDKAHPKAFPRAKYDLEYNIDYGLSFLANRSKKIQGDLNLGFGTWDRTIASYNLGHNPSDASDYEIAKKYVSRVKSNSLKV